MTRILTHARIAVIAEQTDDLSTLEMPADTPVSSPKQLNTSPATPADKTEKKIAHTPASAGKGNKSYHPSPSVAALLHAHSITDASQITGTGPRGRLLKGDILAHLGKISSAAPEKLETRYNALAKLDLSNIRIAAPVAPPAAQKKVEKPKPVAQDLVLEVSLSEILKVQRRLQESIGAAPPLSKFVARATEKANAVLPVRETVDDLFNDLVGAPRDVRVASFQPRIEGIGKVVDEEVDVLDILTGQVSARETGRARRVGVDVRGGNVLKLRVEPGEVESAKMFLGTVKGLLEREAEMLVL